MLRTTYEVRKRAAPGVGVPGGLLVVDSRSGQDSGDDLDVLGAGTFRPAAFVELHFLTFAEFFDADAIQGGVVKEQLSPLSLE